MAPRTRGLKTIKPAPSPRAYIPYTAAAIPTAISPNPPIRAVTVSTVSFILAVSKSAPLRMPAHHFINVEAKYNMSGMAKKSAADPAAINPRLANIPGPVKNNIACPPAAISPHKANAIAPAISVNPAISVMTLVIVSSIFC